MKAKKKLMVIICCAGCFLVFAILFIRNSHNLKYVDLNTGRMRICIEIFGIRIKDDVIETRFSQLWKKYNGEYPKPNWEISIQTPLIGKHHSPGYRCLGVDFCETLILDAFEKAGFDDKLKMHIINYFVSSLSIPSSAGSPQDYAHDIFFLVNNNAEINNTNILSIETKSEIQQSIRHGNIPVEFRSELYTSTNSPQRAKYQ